MTTAPTASSVAARGAGIVLMTLAAGQFVMALDTTVMNTAIATVAEDVGTTVTGIQTAITLYTLVMASFMITGGKVGEIIGRKRAFAIGCVDLRVRVVDDLAGAEPDGADHRLVVPRGLRRGADHAGDRRAGRLELRTARSGRARTGSWRRPARSRARSGR